MNKSKLNAISHLTPIFLVIFKDLIRNFESSEIAFLLLTSKHLYKKHFLSKAEFCRYFSVSIRCWRIFLHHY